MVFPPVVAYAAYKGLHQTLGVCFAVVALGYSFPPSFKGFTFLKDFYIAHCFSPFKKVTRHMEFLPSKETPSIMLYHPHGMFSWGFANAGAWNSFYYNSGVVGLVADALCHAPVFRFWFVKCLGGLGPASKGSFVACLTARRSFGLIPGGFHEATIASPGSDRVFLKDRKGFVKYALQHGFALTPVYTFGENELYDNPEGLWKLRWCLNDLKIPAILPVGRWYVQRGGTSCVCEKSNVQPTNSLFV